VARWHESVEADSGGHPLILHLARGIFSHVTHNVYFRGSAATASTSIGSGAPESKLLPMLLVSCADLRDRVFLRGNRTIIFD
jgi:hypothetical protein